MPIIVKDTHHLYCHHEHSYHTSDKEKNFYKASFKCPVCTFKFTEYNKIKILINILKQEFIIDFPNISVKNLFIKPFLFCFFLRAPPIYTRT